MIERSHQINSFSAILQELRKRLAEPPPGRVQILVGPRQVGKTTLLLELGKGLGSGVVYVAADSPEASLPGWWELLWQRVEGISKGGLAVLLLDEAPYLPNWSRLLKAKIDQVFREKLSIHVVVTGSSALHLGRGTGETMAGRFERLNLTHWPASELAGTFGLDLAETVGRVVVRGSYPGSVPFWNDPPRWRSYILESIIEPAIGRDILMLESIRKPALLRQLFSACAGHPAEIVSLQKLCGLLMEKGALETVAHYLRVLETAYLVAPLQKFSRKEIRRRAAPPKLLILNQAILSAMEPGEPPTQERQPEKWGRWVENACLAHAWNSGQKVTYWREEPLEVDAVMEGSWGKWAVEIKTSPFTVVELQGLFEFCRRNPDFRPLVLGEAGAIEAADRAGIQRLPWRDFLGSGCPQ